MHVMPKAVMPTLLMMAILLSSIAGCSLINPRYAMEDPVYAKNTPNEQTPVTFLGN